jgi:hypothetical protein
MTGHDRMKQHDLLHIFQSNLVMHHDSHWNTEASCLVCLEYTVLILQQFNSICIHTHHHNQKARIPCENSHVITRWFLLLRVTVCICLFFLYHPSFVYLD